MSFAADGYIKDEEENETPSGRGDRHTIHTTDTESTRINTDIDLALSTHETQGV